MKTTVNFNKNQESVSITNIELIELTKNQNIITYLNECNAYQQFCRKQTKHGQARKNERARARNFTYNKCNLTQRERNELEKIKTKLFKLKYSKIEKIKVVINYDGRKKSNLARIIQGVKMAIFTGGLSPQYYNIGLKYFEIIK